MPWACCMLASYNHIAPCLVFLPLLSSHKDPSRGFSHESNRILWLVRVLKVMVLGPSVVRSNLFLWPVQEVTYVDRVRAVCGILKIGNAASAEHRPAAQHAAMAAIKTGVAFRTNPFADDVEAYLSAAAPATRSAAIVQ